MTAESESLAHATAEIARLREELAEAQRALAPSVDTPPSKEGREEQSLFENMLEGFACCRMLYKDQQPHDFRYLKVNRAFAELTGLNDVVGKTVTELIPGIQQSNPELFSIYGRVARTGKGEKFETYLEGLKTWFSVSVYCPEPEHFVAVFENVTERKRAEAALRDANQRLRIYERLVESSPNPFVVVDRDSVYRMVNAAFLRRRNKTAEEVLGHTADKVLGKDAFQRLRPNLEKCFRGEEVRYEDWIDYPDLGSRFVEVSYCPLTGENGQTELVVVEIHDVTDRRRAEEQQRRLETQLLQAQNLESLGVLAGGIAHDFNNILAGIRGYADLVLLDLPPSSPAYAQVEEIRKATRRAAGLTRQMLAYAGKGHVHVEPLDLSQAIDDLKEMLAMAVSKKAALAYNLAADLPAVQADAGQIRQIVMNLVLNASEALGDSSGEISISTSSIRVDAGNTIQLRGDDRLPDGDYVCVQVSDTGCGMDCDVVKKIFDPFFTTKFTGRGLGLAAVDGIVRAHQGAIAVSTQPGEGTTFRVLLRASGANPPPVMDTPPRMQSSPGTGAVLVVDDETIVRESAQALFESAGFKVLTASDGPEALDTYRKHRGDIVCVVLDLTMPTMGGDEIFRELRRMDPDVRVILTSGYSEKEMLKRFADQRVFGFVAKPEPIDSVIAKLREALAGGC